MAKKTPQTPQQAAATAGVGLFGRIRQALSRDKGGKAANAGATQAAASANATAAPVVRKGAITAGITGADRTIAQAHGMFSRVNQVAVFGGMAAGGLASLGKLPLVGGLFRSAATVAEKPSAIMENTKVSDLGHLGTRTVAQARDLAARRLGEDKAIISKLGNVHERLEGVESGLAKNVHHYAHRVSDPLGNVVEKRGGALLGKLSERAANGVTKHSDKAQGTLDAMLSRVSENDALSGLSGSLETAKQAVAGGKLDTEAYSKAMSDAAQELSGVAKGAVDKKVLGALGKDLKKATSDGMAAGQREALAGKLAGFPDAIKSAPDALGQANLRNVALKGAVVTGTALQVTGTARGVGDKVHTLKSLYCDLTGEEKISTRKLLFSKDLPPVIKEARGHIFKEYGPRVVLDFANTIATYTFMKNSNMVSMLGSFGLTAASSLHKAKVQSYGILPMYEGLSKMGEIEDVHYAGFIAAASKDAAAAGGVESPLVQALAVDYAKEGVRPVDILKEIESGRFDERAMHKVQESRQAMEQSGGHALGQTQSEEDRAVLGAHTQRLQEQGRGHAAQTR